MLVLRPADASEATVAWKLAMENVDNSHSSDFFSSEYCGSSFSEVIDIKMLCKLQRVPILPKHVRVNRT